MRLSMYFFLFIGGKKGGELEDRVLELERTLKALLENPMLVDDKSLAQILEKHLDIQVKRKQKVGQANSN